MGKRSQNIFIRLAFVLAALAISIPTGSILVSAVFPCYGIYPTNGQETNVLDGCPTAGGKYLGVSTKTFGCWGCGSYQCCGWRWTNPCTGVNIQNEATDKECQNSYFGDSSSGAPRIVTCFYAQRGHFGGGFDHPAGSSRRG